MRIEARVLVVAGEVLAFGLCPQAKPLLPVIDNTIKSELATQHVTPAQHFMVMTTAGRLHLALTLLTLLFSVACEPAGRPHNCMHEQAQLLVSHSDLGKVLHISLFKHAA